jgi:hypothetical protein
MRRAIFPKLRAFRRDPPAFLMERIIGKPKTEIRNPKEKHARVMEMLLKSDKRETLKSYRDGLIRISEFEFVSDFAFRYSDFYRTALPNCVSREKFEEVSI